MKGKIKREGKEGEGIGMERKMEIEPEGFWEDVRAYNSFKACSTSRFKSSGITTFKSAISITANNVSSAYINNFCLLQEERKI